MRRYRLFAFLGGTASIFAACMIAATSAVCQDSGKPAKLNVERVPTKLSDHRPIGPETWRLARTPNPAGGPDTISIAKIADATRSDHDVAGLMLRCGEGATIEVLVILIEPMPPRTHPKVTVVAGAMTTELTGSVVPGALVLLPEKASALVEHAWQSIPELAVAITENQRSIHGVIPLADINTAMQTLQSNCPKALSGR